MTDNLRLDQFLDAAENDELLAQALKRVEDEASGTREDFFKHGQHGSHNS